MTCRQVGGDWTRPPTAMSRRSCRVRSSPRTGGRPPRVRASWSAVASPRPPRRVSVKVDLDQLAGALADFTFAYLVTVDDSHHAHTGTWPCTATSHSSGRR